jgi:hypothetical protein
MLPGMGIGALLHAYDAWARGRNWMLRIPLLLALLALAYQILWLDPAHNGLFFGINLGIHEAGHLLTRFTTQLICAAAGSAFQCAAPLAAAWILLRQEAKFALPICLVWLSSNVLYVAWYMNDSVELQGTPLTVGGGEGMHDWLFIFTELGLYDHAQTIAGWVHALCVLILLAAIAACAAMMWRMRLVNRSAG